jgi:hypothetical protein
MRGLLRNIPPYKWLLVLPQLTSRICHPQQVRETALASAAWFAVQPYAAVLVLQAGKAGEVN